jgi:hypothetical protein
MEGASAFPADRCQKADFRDWRTHSLEPANKADRLSTDYVDNPVDKYGDETGDT